MAAAERMGREVGRVDVLVNNAAIRPRTPFLDVGYEEWRDVFALTVDSAFALTKALIPGMRERSWGRIVNLTGVRAMQGAALRASSSAAKHALVGLTRSLAAEFGRAGITANVVCPGTVRTDDEERGSPRLAGRRDLSALGRSGEPEDVARVVAFLASDAGGYVTGQSVGANGGELMC